MKILENTVYNLFQFLFYANSSENCLIFHANPLKLHTMKVSFRMKTFVYENKARS